MASVDRQNDAIATRRARLNKDLAEDLLANGYVGGSKAKDHG